MITFVAEFKGFFVVVLTFLLSHLVENIQMSTSVPFTVLLISNFHFQLLDSFYLCCINCG